MAEPTHVRSLHSFGFRSGEWAEILTVVEARERPCYLVRFDDGVTDFMLVDDASDRREYRYADLPDALSATEGNQ